MNYLNKNSSIILFQRTVSSPFYVDKTLLIEEVSKRMEMGQSYVCITRPRRFGKTVNANMLAAYYTKGFDSRNLFCGLAMEYKESFEQHLNQHNVIHIDFSQMPDFCKSYEHYITSIAKKLRCDLGGRYQAIKGKTYDSLSDMFDDTGEQFIFILDEWDAIFYQDFMTVKDKNNYLLFLKSLLKDKSYVEFAYMTGVLPIKKYSSGSELNMFVEYNFMNDHVFDQYFGFQENEVQKLCRKSQTVSYEEIAAWYDGYRTSNGSHLFNPRSVIIALLDGVCRNYWTETGPMNEIADCIEHNVDEVRDDIIKLVSNLSVEIELDGYSAAEQQLNTRNEILSAMVVYGFLSYYEGTLSIPNRELMEKFQRVLARESFGEVKRIVERSKEMLEATLSCDERKVVEILEFVHDEELPILKYNDENSLSCVITLCYLFARNDYIIERELHTGKGYCDFIFFPRRKGKPGIILELKRGGSCKEAIQQIKDRNYVQKLSAYKEILLVGINYDEVKHHTCKIERFQI